MRGNSFESSGSIEVLGERDLEYGSASVSRDDGRRREEVGPDSEPSEEREGKGKGVSEESRERSTLAAEGKRRRIEVGATGEGKDSTFLRI